MLPAEKIYGQPLFERGAKVSWRNEIFTIVNRFPLNATDFIYKFENGNRWVKEEEISPLQ